MSNPPFDGVTYQRCEDCGAFVVEGEADAHENQCGGSDSQWRVEHRFTHGWDDAGWTLEGEDGVTCPQRFANRPDAEQAIAELVADALEACMTGYRAEDYRTVPRSDESRGPSGGGEP